MTEKNPKYMLNKYLDFPLNINQLFFKKVLASNFQNVEKNAVVIGPKNKISVDPAVLSKFRMPLRKKIIIVLLCAYLLICYTFKLISLKKYSRNQNLTFIYSLTREQIYRKTKLGSLYEFINSDRFDINKKSEIWVENKSINLKRKYKNLCVVFDIQLSLYSYHFDFINRLNILTCIYKNLFKFLRFVGKKDANFLIAKEYIFDNEVLNRVNPQKIDKIITTQSHLMFQPLIFEMKLLKSKRFMLWYSSNSIPLEYKRPKSLRYEVPKMIYRYMEIDQHWVWNKEHSDYLTNIMKVKSRVKGPMLFYMPSVSTPVTKEIDVLVFDVTPTGNSEITQNSIYTCDDLKKFVTEIIDACSTLQAKYRINVNVFLKPKRRYSVEHDFNYINFLNDLDRTGRLKILRFDENLYDLVKVSKIVIGYPFVSPVVIGRVEKLASYFYSSSKLLKVAPKYYGKFFIQNPVDLQLELEKVLVLHR
jgi:polysaccharide biosynthesis PFTS motif protein